MYKYLKIASELLLKFSWLALFTLFLVLASLVIHEYFHIWASVIEGGSGSIVFDFTSWNGIPLPITGYATGVEMTEFVEFAGGFFTGLIFIITGLWAKFTKTFQDYYVEFGFLLCGLCHLVYSFWEVTMLGEIPIETYLMYNNYLHITVASLFILSQIKNIKRYIL